MVGIPATIVKLDWQLEGEQTPADLPNFESLARRLRYRALGKACRSFRINTLMLAHHKDDQAETILLRLNAGYTGTGLAGIQSRARIPECAGMYGVHGSGGPPASSHDEHGEDMSVATGGIEIVRPLLQFSKVELYKLCHENGVSWIEDATNQVVSLTPRNAIRNMLKNKRLPRALNKPALIRLADIKGEQMTVTKHAAVDALTRLNPTINYEAGPVNFEVTGSIHASINQSTALNVLKTLASRVSSQDDISKQQLVTACSQVFPHISTADGESEGPRLPVTRVFTAADVLWEGSSMVGDNTKWRWQLSRQRPSKPFPLCTWSSETLENGHSQRYGTWQLFDGRYWVRAYHAERKPLSLQLLSEDSLKRTRQGVSKERRLELDNLLHEFAPGRLRFTLLAFVDDQTGTVLALPTLQWRIGHSKSIKWELQYKQVF